MITFGHVTKGARVPVEPLRWTHSGRVQVRQQLGVGAGRFFPVSPFQLKHAAGRDALARVLRALPVDREGHA